MNHKNTIPSVMQAQKIAAISGTTITESGITKSPNLTDFLDNRQLEKLNKWLKKKKKVNTGAIGGRYTWQFTPTGLGYVIKVRDNIKKDEIDLTDVEDW